MSATAPSYHEWVTLFTKSWMNVQFWELLCRELLPLKPLICWPRCALLTVWFLWDKWNLAAVQLKYMNLKIPVVFWAATWKLASSRSSSLPPAHRSSFTIPMCLLQCRDALTTRQKLIAQDYKVSYSLAKSCKSDLKKYRCNVENLPRSREARLSYLLMCLESAVHRGKCSSRLAGTLILNSGTFSFNVYLQSPSLSKLCFQGRFPHHGAFIAVVLMIRIAE